MPAKPESFQTVDIMERLRARVRDSAEKLEDVLPTRKQASLETSQAYKARALAFSEDLRYLNAEYNFPTRINPLAHIQTHRTGFIAKVILKVKHKVFGAFWDLIDKSMTAQWRDYQAHLVRFLNMTADYTDERDGAIFWELVRKIDTDNQRIDELARECRATLHSFQEQQNQLITKSTQAGQTYENRLHALQIATETTDKVARGVEATFQRLARLPVPETASESKLPDPSYVVFENRFRGSEDEIRSRLQIYVDTFRPASKNVLDIGCGRGELLKLFQENNIESYGVDLDDAMVRLAAEKKVTALFGDGIKHLASLPSDSLGGVVAIQVVEHLPLKILQGLLEQSFRVIAPGGSIAFETINPRSVSALYSNYFRDPTHVFPVHPETLQHLAVSAGFSNAHIVELSPIPDAAKLLPIEPQPFMTPQWQGIVTQLNHNVSLLNDLLYGAQDYCIIATK